jgi:hypothetical protein
MASPDTLEDALAEPTDTNLTNMELDGSTDVDMLDSANQLDRDDVLDYSDPADPGPILPLTPLNIDEEPRTPLNLDEVPETLDLEFTTEVASGDDGEPGELTSEQIEDIANSEAVRGGEIMSQEQHELQNLSQELRALRVDRDVVVKMETCMGAELRAVPMTDARVLCLPGRF